MGKEEVGKEEKGGEEEKEREEKESNLIILGAFVSAEQICVLSRLVGDFGTAGGCQIVAHAGVEGKDGGGGADLSAHVANRRHTRARHRIHAGADILDDGAGTALDNDFGTVGLVNQKRKRCGSTLRHRNSSRPAPTLTVRIPATLVMMSLAEVQPDMEPVNLTPITLGHLSSHGRPAITSTASAPPTPMQRPERDDGQTSRIRKRECELTKTDKVPHRAQWTPFVEPENF